MKKSIPKQRTFTQREMKDKNNNKISDHLKLQEIIKNKYKDLIPIKCLSDHIWLYCRYLYDYFKPNLISGYYIGYNRIGQTDLQGDTVSDKIYEDMQHYYQQLRGEILSDRPSNIAVALFYICCYRNRVYISQKYLGDVISVSQGTVRRANKKLYYILKLDGQ